MIRTPPSRLAATLMLVLAGCALTSGAAVAKPYGNPRFDYWIDYPENLLVPEREADNSDGERFHARNGTAEMRVWGAYNALDQSPKEMVREYERDWGLGAEAHACNLKSSTDPSGQVRSEYVAPPVLLA